MLIFRNAERVCGQRTIGNSFPRGLIKYFVVFRPKPTNHKW